MDYFFVIMKLFCYLLLPLLLCFSCIYREDVKTFTPPVRVCEVTMLKGVEKSFAGLFIPAVSTVLAFKSGGDIDSLAVNDGESVKKGQFIASISNITFLANVESAKARYLVSRSNKDRYNRLLRLNAVSKQQAESAQANYVSAQSTYDNALESLAETKLFAPFSGVVEECYVDKYQRVGAAQQVVKIINPDSLEVEFTISPADLPLLTHSSLEFVVQSLNSPKRTFSAQLDRYVGVVNQSEGYRVFVKIVAPDFKPIQMGLRAGNSCNVILKVSSPMDSSYFALPLTAIFNGANGQNSVWVVDDSLRVHLKKVNLGELMGSDSVVVKGGLAMGSKVVCAGIYRLSQGEKVKIEKRGVKW